MKTVIAIVSILLLPNVLIAQPSDQGVFTGGLDLALTNLSEFERDLSPMHMELIEPLNTLADQLILEGQHEQAHKTLDRAVQIIRVSEGLYTPNQFPFQEKKVLNTVESGNWTAAREQLDHLYWLYTEKGKYATPGLMSRLIRISDIHLRGVSEDATEYQAHHLRRGIRADSLALAIGESVWGAESPLLVPIIYRMVNHLHLEKVATNRPGETSRILRTVTVNFGVQIRSIEYMDLAYYQTGDRLLNKIKDIYSAQEPENLEAIAMAQLYIADWGTLFRQNGDLLATYKTIFDNLLEAGEDSADINAFFARPKLLPEPQFYPTLELALSASTFSSAREGLGEMDTRDKTVFSEWSSNFPLARQPSQLPIPENENSAFTLFSFNIVGAAEIARSLSKSKHAKIGVAKDLKVLDQTEFTDFDVSMLKRRVQSFHFRPRLVDGVPERVDTTLVYIPATAY